MRAKQAGLALLVLMIASCQAIPGTYLPTVPIAHVQMTPALRPWQTHLSHCALKEPKIGLVVSELPASGLTYAQADISMRLGIPANLSSPSIEVGFEKIVVIHNPASATVTLRLQDLAYIYAGQLTSWGQIIKNEQSSKGIHVWTYPPGDDLRQAFEQGLSIHNSARSISVAPDPEAMLEAVAKDPDALGYITSSWQDPKVALTPIKDGSQNAFLVPVLAIYPPNPTRPVNNLLVCLQTGNN